MHHLDRDLSTIDHRLFDLTTLGLEGDGGQNDGQNRPRQSQAQEEGTANGVRQGSPRIPSDGGSLLVRVLVTNTHYLQLSC